MSNDPQARIKPKHLWLKVSMGIILLLIIWGGTHALGMYNNVKETINGKMYQPLPAINQVESEDKVKNKEPINLLLLAINKQERDSGRAESLIVLSLNPKTDSMTLITIPRNTRASIVGKELEDKIIQSYTYGGPNMAIESVENLLDIELDYYIQLNLAGVADLVDGLGGIIVNNEVDFEEGDISFTSGELHLNGTQVVRLVELLDSYQGEDVDQTEIHGQLFEAIIEKGTTATTLNKVNAIANFLEDNLKANIDYEILEDFGRNYSSVGKNVTEYTLEGSKAEIDNEDYLIVSDEEIAEVHKMIME